MLTDYTRIKILDHILKVQSYASPTTIYAAFFTENPGDNGSLVNEADYGDYSRKPIIFNAASGRTITQASAVTFNVCISGNNTITYIGLIDSLTTGNMLAYNKLKTARIVTTGYQPYLANGEVKITIFTGSFYTSYASLILDWLFRNQPLSQPDNIYISMHSSACTDSTAGIELTQGAYSRIQCNSWASTSSGLSTNLTTVYSVTATANWATTTFLSLYNSLTTGTKILYGDCDNLVVSNVERARFGKNLIKIFIT